MLIRTCPNPENNLLCRGQIKYKALRSYKGALKNNSLCKSCSNAGKNNPMYGKDGYWKNKKRLDLVGKNNYMYGKTGEQHPNYGKRPKTYGKTYEEIYGKEKARELKKIISKNAMGDKNPSKRKEVKEKISHTLINNYPKLREKMEQEGKWLP